VVVGGDDAVDAGVGRRIKMALSTETAERVEALYLERLDAHFKGELSFGPIVVEPTRDSEGKDTFRVTIVYEGNDELPDPKKAITVMTSLTGDFEALGLPPVLIHSYVSKEEYPELLRLRKLMPWDEDED
jgi:hypothetical protein